MSTLQRSGQESGSPKTCPIFIAYRDDDGREHAEWLFRHLSGRAVPLTASDASGPPVVDAFFDKNNPPSDDFLKYNQPNLEARWGLFLSAPMAQLDRKAPHLGEDWLYREIDWWLRKRGTSPLLIRASSKSPYIPLEIQRKWPKAQWVELDLHALKAASDEERNERAERIIGRVLRGIADSRSGVVYEELQRQKQLGRRFLVAAIVAGVLAVAAVGLALWANKSRHEADVAAQAATKSENKAVEARKTAEYQARIADSRRLAAEARSSLGSGHPQQALILAVEAVKATRDLGEPIVPATETTLHEVLGHVGGTSLSSHERSILALGFAPDGRLVTASSDKTARVWDLTNPAAEPLVLRGHKGSSPGPGVRPRRPSGHRRL